MNRYLLLALFYIITNCVSAKCDTLKINELLNNAEKQITVNINVAHNYAKQAYAQASNCKQSKQYLNAAIALAKAFYFRDEYDSILNILLPIEKHYLQNADAKTKGEVFHKIGVAYANVLKLELSVTYSLKALQQYETIKDSAGICNAYVNLGYTYNKQKNFKNALKYFKLAEVAAIGSKKDTQLGNVYNFMGILFAENNKFKEALEYMLKATKIRESKNDLAALQWNYNNLGGVYSYLAKNKEALFYYEKAFESFKKFNNYDGLSSVANNLGVIYTDEKNFKKALEFYNYSRVLYAQTNDPDNLENLYTNLSVYYDKIGDLKTAFKYSDSLLVLKDSLYGKRLDKAIAEMDIKYQSEKKDLQLAKNKSELNVLSEKSKQKTIVVIAIISGLLLLFALFFSHYKNKTNKQLIEQQNEASLKIIQSEQTERMRIARELHDGIGQKLTVLKMYASVNETENKKQIDLLDSTINEVRGISHNLMPEIINLGLVPAVKDLCFKINEVGTINCVFNYDKERSLKFATNIELSIYRIVQEVLNNMIKHANAKKIAVSFDVTNNNLKISIADDGVGFDTKKIYTSSGIGWSNIITRAKIINANLDVNSNNKGTHIILNINI